eukprot:5548489-Pyramimonas_sp.AAC.1
MVPSLLLLGVITLEVQLVSQPPQHRAVVLGLRVRDLLSLMASRSVQHDTVEEMAPLGAQRWSGCDVCSACWPK